ncbi:unnamed protein product [Prunus brigantina]
MLQAKKHSMIHEEGFRHFADLSPTKETSQNPLAARAKEEPGGQGELEIPNSNEVNLVRLFSQG